MKKEKNNLEQFYQTLVIIWFALFVSQFLLLVVLYLVKPELFQFDFSEPLLGKNAPIIIIFALAAVLNIAVSFFLKKKYLSQAVSEKNVHFVQTAMIVGCAMCESISLFGLMLAFVADYQYFFLWFIAGIGAMIFHFPRRDNLFAAGFER
jgi:F0F1-type ATP synthase membrane subunit c/vacuolar-type H+-ATPase subunit K